jgi:hypothetical protein
MTAPARQARLALVPAPTPADRRRATRAAYKARKRQDVMRLTIDVPPIVPAIGADTLLFSS